MNDLTSRVWEDRIYAHIITSTLPYCNSLINMVYFSGFLEVKSACCGIGKLYAEGPCIPLSKYCPNRSDHIFWDEVHPTEATAKILVNTLFNNTKKYVTSMNLTIM